MLIKGVFKVSIKMINATKDIMKTIYKKKIYHLYFLFYFSKDLFVSNFSKSFLSLYQFYFEMKIFLLHLFALFFYQQFDLSSLLIISSFKDNGSKFLSSIL